MIPKIVHYCWFGRKEKPDIMKKCIDTWHKILIGYEFFEWNEDNFDVNQNEYVRQAYDNHKYAFVSDIARIQALEQYGGIYMDTDVEVYKLFDELLDYRCVLGFEYGNWVATSFMACEPKYPLLKEFYQAYNHEKFICPDGSLNLTTNVQRLTNILEEKGLIRNNKKQQLKDGIVIFPIEYFSPYDYANCIMEKTSNSFCAHLFVISWMSKKEHLKKQAKAMFTKVFGKERLIELRDKMK